MAGSRLIPVWEFQSFIYVMSKLKNTVAGDGPTTTLAVEFFSLAGLSWIRKDADTIKTIKLNSRVKNRISNRINQGPLTADPWASASLQPFVDCAMAGVLTVPGLEYCVHGWTVP